MESQKPNCGFYRARPEENRCVEGNCYYGDTEEAEQFGNCCFLCPKKTTCPARCSYIDELTELAKDEAEGNITLAYLDQDDKQGKRMVK